MVYNVCNGYPQVIAIYIFFFNVGGAMIKRVLGNFILRCQTAATCMRGLFSSKSIALAMGVTVLLSSGFVFAAGSGGGVSLTDIQGNIETATQTVGKILTDIAVLAGVGFVLASLFKFHQHKLNPTQVPISQGVTLLLVGAALLVFPLLLSTTTQAVFKKDAGSTSSDISGILKGAGSGKK